MPVLRTEKGRDNPDIALHSLGLCGGASRRDCLLDCGVGAVANHALAGFLCSAGFRMLESSGAFHVCRPSQKPYSQNADGVIDESYVLPASLCICPFNPKYAATSAAVVSMLVLSSHTMSLMPSSTTQSGSLPSFPATA